MSESALAARVLNALLREDYGGLSRQISRTRDGVRMSLPDGMVVRLVPGRLYQDFVVAPEERLRLAQVLGALDHVADPADAEGVAAFAEECAAALMTDGLRDRQAPTSYEALAATLEHPVYPTARARIGLTADQLLAYAPEFAPTFALRWVAVPGHDEPFPVHPLTLGRALEVEGTRAVERPDTLVRPTLSMRTVELDARTHLKLPLPVSTLGTRNRRSIRPGTLRDGALAELLVRRLADPDVLVADEQTYAETGHEYLAWMIRRLPAGEIVPVAALTAPGVLDRFGDVLPGYLRILLRWNVRLFVEYGVALEAHQQNLALVFAADGMRLLVKDNDGLLASPARLAAAGVAVPAFGDGRMLTDDPHALADVFVTITLHLAAAAVAFGALPYERAARLLRATLAEALDEHGEHPMARLLRARTLDAARLTGKSMVTAGTLVAKERTGARDVNKFYGASGPNYLRRA
ncbi:IucA/IucC family protein [Nonomuraea longicatena]|uniref:IucA/IucC family protein n=1 Tax=Nonomuraea longicatena TaxID=83682 RepID=A0ABN1R202_9ACTN